MVCGVATLGWRRTLGDGVGAVDVGGHQDERLRKVGQREGRRRVGQRHAGLHQQGVAVLASWVTLSTSSSHQIPNRKILGLVAAVSNSHLDIHVLFLQDSNHAEKSPTL